ncbi:transcriptional activator protein [Fraxinus symptomless virus]|nr:transcriptional activator protein [Fraxinus symptomless virus]
MQNSSSPTPPSIGAKHHRCKRKKRLVIKPRRLELPCGCIIHQTIECRNHGFQHRGATHMAATTSRRIHLGTEQPVLDSSPTLWTDDESTVPPHVQRGTEVQLQPQNEIGNKESVVDYPHLDDIKTDVDDDKRGDVVEDDFWEFIPTSLFLYP